MFRRICSVQCKSRECVQNRAFGFVDNRQQDLAEDFFHVLIRQFFEEIVHQYSDILLQNKVRWLSEGSVLKRLLSLLTEMKTFFDEEKEVK